MPDTTLSQAIKEAYASAPVSTIIYNTIELRHPAFSTPVRLVRDYANLTATLEATAPAPGDNPLTYPNDFTNAVWPTTGWSVIANDTASPSGFADRITSVSGVNALSRLFIANSTRATFTCIIKAGTHTLPSILIRNNTTATSLVSMNISTGVALGDGWYRMTVTATSGFSIGQTLGLYFGATGAVTPGQYYWIDSATLDTGVTTFIAMGFTFKRPEVTANGLPQIQLEIDNIDRAIVANLEAALTTTNSIELTFREYLSSDLSVPQNNPPVHMTILSVTATVFKVTAVAGFRNLMNIKFPRTEYDAQTFPGLS